MASEDIRAQPAPASTGFPAYLFAHGAWFLAFGVQVVLFPYLVKVVLHESEVRFGLAQMALQAPTTLLILIGGFVADRSDAKRIVVAGCALAVACFLVLGGLVISGQLTYGLMIGYALSVGVIGAFAIPARDSLLSLVAPGSIQGGVAVASLVQFGAQIVGMVCAAAAPLFGVGPLLLAQAALMALATLAAASLRPRPAAARGPVEPGGLLRLMVTDIVGGVRAAAASPVIAPVLICSVAIGVCFMGSFFVLLPLIVVGYFPEAMTGAGDTTRVASALGLFSLCFWVGSTASALALVRLGARLRRKGLAYITALAGGGGVLILCAVPMPFPALCALNFVWGLGGGVAMTLGRSLVQQHAPAETRGRILAIFTLGYMGGGPLGAVAYGFLAKALGPHAAILIPGLMMLAIVGAVSALTGLKSLREEG